MRRKNARAYGVLDVGENEISSLDSVEASSTERGRLAMRLLSASSDSFSVHSLAGKAPHLHMVTDPPLTP